MTLQDDMRRAVVEYSYKHGAVFEQNSRFIACKLYYNSERANINLCLIVCGTYQTREGAIEGFEPDITPPFKTVSVIKGGIWDAWRPGFGRVVDCAHWDGAGLYYLIVEMDPPVQSSKITIDCPDSTMYDERALIEETLRHVVAQNEALWMAENTYRIMHFRRRMTSRPYEHRMSVMAREWHDSSGGYTSIGVALQKFMRTYQLWSTDPIRVGAMDVIAYTFPNCNERDDGCLYVDFDAVVHVVGYRHLTY